MAWRNIRDGVMAQRALYETEIVDMPQVVLPVATAAKGQTLYEKMAAGKVLLGEGRETGLSQDSNRLRTLVIDG